MMAGFFQNLTCPRAVSGQSRCQVNNYLIIVLCDDDASQLNVLPEPICLAFGFLPGFVYDRVLIIAKPDLHVRWSRNKASKDVWFVTSKASQA